MRHALAIYALVKGIANRIDTYSVLHILKHSIFRLKKYF